MGEPSSGSLIHYSGPAGGRTVRAWVDGGFHVHGATGESVARVPALPRGPDGVQRQRAMLSVTPGDPDLTYAKSVVQFRLQRLREAVCSAYVRLVVPPEHDPRILDALRRAFADPTSNAVEFKRTARTGGYRDDEGLENLLPAELPLSDKQRLLKEAIVRCVDQGNTPTVVTYEGDDVRGEPVRFHEFRLVVTGVGLYVKVYLEPDGLNDPTARVCSVKRADPR